MLNLSILGDSISAYEGISDDTSANATIGANPYFYPEEFPLEKTYWMQIIDALGMKLCVNNSWSGGNLSGVSDESAGVNRAAQLSRDDGTVPDVIIVFMGMNDLGRNVDISVFSADYEKTLATIKEKYPDAKVCCVNLPDRDVFLKQRAALFNAAIESAVASAGSNFFLADIYRSRLNNDFYYMNTVDGLHPDEDGMRIIADIIKAAMRANISVNGQ